MEKKTYDEIKICYNLTAIVYSQKFLNELDQKPFDRNILDRFSEMVPADGSIYDFGCGSGQTTKYLNDKNRHRIVGLDFSEDSIIIAEKNFPGIRFVVDDMLDSKMDSSTADGIIAFYAIVHFEYNDIKIVLKEWHRLLKNKGYCLFSFHVGEELVRIENFLNVKGATAAWRFLNVDTILSLAGETGFKIIDAVIRYPYKGIEHESKRAYIIMKKETAE
jgi:SAM-dependent methyltransferase